MKNLKINLSNLRTSEMMFLVTTLAFITTICLLVNEMISNEKKPGVMVLIVFILLITYVAGICLAHYHGSTSPQILEEGKAYTFIGADEEKKWIFLEEHVHTDAVVNSNTDISMVNYNYDNSPSLIPAINIPEEDYDLPGIYRGEIFHFDIKKGEKVKAVKFNGKMGIQRA